MAYSGGIITAPVRTIDIAQALGVSSRNVGRLCQHANINKWAKNKPFRSDIIRPATAQDRIGANYGLNFVVTEGEVGNDVIGAVKRAAQDTSCYTYDTTTTGHLAQGKPRGRAYNEWYRMRDFNGYWHDAPAPIQGFSANDLEINRFLYDTDITREIYATDIEVSAYQLSLADVIAGVQARMGIDISNWYLILAVQYNNTGGFYQVSEEKIGQTGRRFRFNLRKDQLPNGTPNFYFAAIEYQDARYSSRVIGLPFLRNDIAGYGYGQFNVYTRIPFQFDWQRVDTYSGAPSLSWENMDTNQYRARYYQYHDESGEADVHLQMSGDCDMAYGFKVTNTDTTSAYLIPSHITLQSLSVAASGWTTGSISYQPTGKIAPSYAYYSTTRTGSWQAFPSSGQLIIGAGGTVYLWLVMYQFQRKLNGIAGSAISGQSTRGAELQLYYDDTQQQLCHEEYWERNGYINIKV